MLAMIATSLALAADAPATTVKPSKEPSRYCREINDPYARSDALLICRTRQQWKNWEKCHSATRSCAGKMELADMGVGRPTAYPMNENSRIICRKLRVTGTRLRMVETCLPQREWDRMWAESSESTLKRIEQYSTMPRSWGQ